jgi:hypothetical protein
LTWALQFAAVIAGEASAHSANESTVAVMLMLAGAEPPTAIDDNTRHTASTNHSVLFSMSILLRVVFLP